jgi:hypothetical protein
METLNVIHAGYVRSKKDGTEHFIDYYKLIDLYCLNPKKCISVHNPNITYCKQGKHYYPRADGDYTG